MPRIRVMPDPQAVAEAAGEVIVLAAADAVRDFDAFNIALSGGQTPQLLYQLLAAEPYLARVPWDRTHIFFVDERCVPPAHADSNFGMVNRILLDAVPVRPENIHRMRGEIEPEAAAREYGQLLKTRFGEYGVDLAILGMGEDGHTASLFPGSPALEEKHHRCVANYVEKLNGWRLTMTAPFLNCSRQIMVLVTGLEKSQIAQEVLEGGPDPMRLPIQLINPASGELSWLMDVAAAGM